MAYTTVVNGVTVTSNVPFDQVPSSGSLVEIDIHFTLPIAQLELLGYDVLHAFGQQTYIDQIAAQGFDGTTITNYNVYVVDDFTLRIAYIMHSFAVYVAVAAVAVIVVALAFAFVAYLGVQVANSPAGQAIGIALAVGLGAAFIIGTGVFAYGFYKSREFRQETLRGATEALRFGREKVAPAIVRGTSSAISSARKGLEYGRQKLREAEAD